MKNIKLSLILGISVLALASSCKKMDLYPYNSIERSQSFQTVKDASYWNTGTHAFLKSRAGGTYNLYQDLQADQFNATIDYGNRNGSVHRMDVSFVAEDGVLSGPWSAFYSAINNANVAIDGYSKITPANAAETDSLAKYSGTARFARAHYYNELMLRYSKSYNPASAATDLGVPITLEYNPNAQPARATAKAVYDQILKDITDGKANLAKFAGAKGASRINRDAITALEARVKLYTQDWAGAYAAAKSLIDGGLYPLYNTAASVKSYWHNDTKNEDIIQIHGSQSALFNTVGATYLGYNVGANLFVPDFLPTQSVIDMYADNDFRKPVYFESKVMQFQGVKYDNTLKAMNKFPGNPALFTGATTNYQHYIKLLRIGEQYLIAAEAAYRNGGDEANARKYLNDLRTARGLAATNATGTALYAEIKAERNRELAFEGFRLWDIKRWGESVVRGTPQNLTPIMTTPADSFHQLNRPNSYSKLVWGIPANDILINPNIAGQQNPGW